LELRVWTVHEESHRLLKFHEHCKSCQVRLKARILQLASA